MVRVVVTVIPCVNQMFPSERQKNHIKIHVGDHDW